MLKKIACIDSKPLEITLAIQALLFGGFLLLPGNTFESTQVYHVLSMIFQEGAWGIIFVSAFALEIIAVFNQTGRLRGTAASLALFLWLIVDLSSWLSNINSAATVTYFTFVLMALWSVIAISTRDYFDCDD